MEHPGVGSLLPSLRLLHERGHHVHLASDSLKSAESQREMEELAEECPGITFSQLPSMGHSGWVALAASLRRSIDYLRYLEPRYREATKLRARAAGKAPPAMRRLGPMAARLGPRAVAGLRRSLQSLERCLAPPKHLERFLQEQRPDVLLLAHLLPVGTTHADYLRAAKRVGIRSVFPVRGWDNLTNKGLLRDSPDLVLVWNDLQAREAEELHRVPPEKIRLTGAPLCDPWFEREPTRSREELCLEVGLRADRPIVLYVCSSGFVARHEVAFVKSWIERLRARGGVFAEVSFLVRPHPLNAAQWADAELGDPHATVWPRFGEAPHDEASRGNYFDSIFHSAVVVGINTTAQIESAIVGRPVHTVLAEEFRATQEGTLHFHYLQADEFGLLHVGHTFEEHAEQLEASLSGRVDDRNERFLRRFVRPCGLERSASGLVAEAIEELGWGPAPAVDHGPLAAPLVRLGLAPFAALAGRGSERRRQRRAARSTPTYELRRLVRKRALHRSGLPVVAGPWLGDEIGEVLYWIPFLRWVEAKSEGLRERLFVVCRGSSTPWYAGIGAGTTGLDQFVPPDRLEELRAGLVEEGLQGPLREEVARTFGLGSRAFRVLPAGLIQATRAELARQKPQAKQRLIDFAPLVAPELPAGLELPDEFLAVRSTGGKVAAALAERFPVVSLDGLDRAAQTAVVARARGFVGTYGVEAYLAVLAGVPAVAFASGSDHVNPDDLRLVSSFLARPPFGRLQVVETALSVSGAVERATELLDARAEALAAV
jgi:hypothetical protein